MKRIRLGNTFEIVWEIFLGKDKDKGKYDLTGKKLTIYLVSAFERIKISDFTTEFNVLRFTFEGKEQKHAGRYQLTFVENEGGDDARTLNKCDAFEIVQNSCMETDDLSELNLSSSFDALRIYPIIPQVGPNGNWWVDGVDTGHSSIGTSAYEYALSLGYEGTEEEYAAECLAVPVLNEESRIATAAALEATEQSIAQQESVDNTMQGVQGYMDNVVAPAITSAQQATENAENAAENANNASEEASTSASQAAAAAASANNAAENADAAAEEAHTAAQNAEGATKRAEEAIEAFGPAIANKADKIKFEGKSYVETDGISTNDFYYSMPDSADGTEDDIIATKSNLKKINGQDLFGKGNIVIEGKNYDNEIAEQSAKLTELSEENERLRDRIEEQDQFIEDLQNTKIDRENDDYYPKMAVGLADNLAGVDVVDSEINFRRSGGGAISDGVARIEAIKGNSVVWNQLWDINGDNRTDNVANMTINEGEVVLTIQEGRGNNSRIRTAYTIGVVGHKYYVTYQAKYNSKSDDSSLIAFVGMSNSYGNQLPLTNSYQTYSGIWVGDYAGSMNVGIIGTRNDGDIVSFKDIKVIDLTQMFQAGNEPTTIEEFYARKPIVEDEYAYNEGEVIHMNVQSIESVGVNQWDEEWELGRVNPDTGTLIVSTKDIRSKNFIRVIPGKDYYFIGSSQYYVVYYDKDYQHVDWWSISSYRVLTIPNNVHYVKLSRLEVTTYKGDICINLSDTSINGKYYPYIKRVEDLSLIRKYFPDGMKSAGSAHDEIRYNKTTQKREKVVRIGEVDMGALTYRRAEIKNTNETYYVIYTYGLKDIVKLPSYRDIGNVLTQGYLAKPALSLFDYILAEKTIMLYEDGTLYIRDDAYTNVESFKAAMQGVMLYYELAEPIITELDKEDQLKDWDYSVWNAGTEKAIAEGKSAPLAADITYGFNAIGKIKELESLVAALRAKVGI